VITLGRTPKRRAVDVLAYFDRPGESPERLQHFLRGLAGKNGWGGPDPSDWRSPIRDADGIITMPAAEGLSWRTP
jgi:hypothetical protein